MSLIDKDLVKVTNLKRISVEGGDVLHGIKSYEEDFKNFGEAYFSLVENGYIKSWKRHMRMTMNLIVPIGLVQFNFYSPQRKLILNKKIGEDEYCRLTVSPGVWFGFKGLCKGYSYILNISDINHDPLEVEKMPNDFLPFLDN